jgi:uncharacterized membrane protein
MAWLTLKAMHVLAVVVWVGGMAFAHFFLRPAVQVLEPPQRLALMRQVLGRFLPAAGAAVVVVLVTGLGLVALWRTPGGAAAVPTAWVLMGALGFVMAVIYAAIRFAMYPRFVRALDANDLPAAAAALAQLRAWVGINLVFGLVVIAIAGFR